VPLGATGAGGGGQNDCMERFSLPPQVIECLAAFLKTPDTQAVAKMLSFRTASAARLDSALANWAGTCPMCEVAFAWYTCRTGCPN
jgi:hypothetical protein